MWYECLKNTEILREIYNDIPVLNDVNINDIVIHLPAKKIAMSFEMPVYCDNPLETWGYHKVPVDTKQIISVDLSFVEVDIFHFKNIHGSHLNGNIDISITSQNNINININGIVNFLAEAKEGQVDSVDRYFISACGEDH